MRVRAAHVFRWFRFRRAGSGNSAARVAAVFVLGAVSTGCVSTPAAVPFYDYTVRLDLDADPPVAAVNLRITGLLAPQLELALPPGSTFARLEFPLVEGPWVVSPIPGRFFPTESPFAWVLEGGETTTVTWRVPHHFREHERVRAASDGYEFPFIGSDHALLYTPTLFLLPKPAGRCRVRFDLPEGWSARTPWGEGGAHFEGNTDALRDDYIVLGNWTERTVRLGEFVGTIAFSPDVAALADLVADRIAQVLAAEFEMFGVEARGRYLVVFGPSPGAQLGGSPKAHSMTLAVDPDLVAEPPAWLETEIVHLVAHEFHHTWTNGKPPLPDELRWYAEGFTDYMAWLLCARLGLSDPARWHRRIVSTLAEIEALPAYDRISLVEAGGEAFFDGGEEYQLIYGGGFLAALWLDLELERAAFPAGLEGFMRGFNNDPTIIERAPTLEEFLAAVEGVLGRETSQVLVSIVTRPSGLDRVVRPIRSLGPEELWARTVRPVRATEGSLPE